MVGLRTDPDELSFCADLETFHPSLEINSARHSLKRTPAEHAPEVEDALCREGAKTASHGALPLRKRGQGKEQIFAGGGTLTVAFCGSVSLDSRGDTNIPRRARAVRA